MRNKFIEWYKKKYSKKQRLLSFIPLAAFFIVILPLGLRYLSLEIDKLVGLSKLLPVPFNLYFGIPLLLIGFYVGLWANVVLFEIGEGTPLPMIPTQKVVIKAPYTFCRNPMTLGTGIL